MSETVERSDPVTITDLAAENIRRLLVERGLADHFLRVYVAGMGCSGLQYGLALDEAPQNTDTVIESDGIRVLIDPNSLSYLEGARIDYVESPQGGGFKIDNPNPLAASACGSCPSTCS